jgi:biotin carboxylase
VKRILLVMPTAWDAKQLAGCPELGERFELVWSEPADADCPASLDPGAFVAEAAAGRWGAIHGVATSSDYPGALLACAIAARLGLPGPSPGAVLRCSHKWYSRLAQRESVPEATPAFDLLAPHGRGAPAIGFPCFVKPVKSAYSILARRVTSEAELAAYRASPRLLEFFDEYLRIFHRIVRETSDLELDGRWLIAEEVAEGRPVTVEGWAADGDVGLLGVVDSTCDPATGSFLRFDYPSALDPGVQERMGAIARRAILHLGLDRSLFNLEMFYDAARDRISIIEINPRMCGQFADLYAKVDGTNGYEVALALAAGERPAPARGRGAFAAAASFPLRVFQPVRVERAPDARDVRAAEARFPGTLVWNECANGDLLTDFESGEDGRSQRYAVVNLGGADRADCAARLAELRSLLGHAFEPLAAPPAAPAGSRA